MARFSLRRPSELFRRTKTAEAPRPPPSGSSNNNTTTTSGGNASGSRRVRQSISLGRLRDKLASSDEDEDDGVPPPPPLPTAFARPPSAVPITTANSPTTTTAATTTAQGSPPPSSLHSGGSETLASDGGTGRRPPVPGSPSPFPSFDSERAGVEVRELRLDDPETPPRPPHTGALWLQTSTPQAQDIPQQPNGTGLTAQDRPRPRPSSPERRPNASGPAHAPELPSAHHLDVNAAPAILDSPTPSGALSSAADGAPPPAVGPRELDAAEHLADDDMLRKVWVRRPNGSATLVQVQGDDLVDDVRDMILRKYANSLGRSFDSPDMTLRIVTRAEHGGQRIERNLGPEEDICRTLDHYYPGGQRVDEALIIDMPKRNTPRPSPRAYVLPPHVQGYTAVEDFRPLETGTDYFPPMPTVVPPTQPQTSGSQAGRDAYQNHHGSVVDPHHAAMRAMTVLTTGQVPPLPSPGLRSRQIKEQHGVAAVRPKFQPAQTLASIPLVGQQQAQNMAHRPSAFGRPRLESSASDRPHLNGTIMGGPNTAPQAPPLPTPPAPEAPPTKNLATPPTPSVQAPSGLLNNHATRPKKGRRRTPENANSKHRDPKRMSVDNPNLAASILDGSVPPINVLIVEDNIINMRILEGLMKRLKVRWQTAMNGQIAVDKWRAGGFHLVLMDIQMPVMNGTQATKEIRRLERVNGIGVFSSSSPGEDDAKNGANANGNGSRKHDPKDDKLQLSEGFFKSPVIIVALTASSLQSDRHEALAAGCNDFLTKPVNFVWLERKVKEWGCMQALIDFDGWRKWKDYASNVEAGKSEEQKEKDRLDDEKQRKKAEKLAILQEKQRKRAEEEKAKKEAERRKREEAEAAEAAESAEAGDGITNGDGAEGPN